MIVSPSKSAPGFTENRRYRVLRRVSEDRPYLVWVNNDQGKEQFVSLAAGASKSKLYWRVLEQ